MISFTFPQLLKALSAISVNVEGKEMVEKPNLQK